MPRFDVITFDCYGTLIDWETGIRKAFLAGAAAAGVKIPPEKVVPAYAEIEPRVEEEAYRPYREVLARTAVGVAEHFGWKLALETARFLPESLPSWAPFPDTNPALEKLSAAGCRLGILSNVDDDLLAGTRRHFSVAFAPIVTAAQVRSYKPAHAHFLEARRRIPAGARWLHAAQSYFHDVVPCKTLGIPVAWINRKGEKAGAAAAPERELRDLAGLAAWVTDESEPLTSGGP